MSVPLVFMRTMFVNGIGLAVWITLLLLVNMAVPLLFVTTVEGQWVLAAMMLGALTQMAIFRSQGFVRLLGVGHIYWVPLLPWLWTRLDRSLPPEPFAMWMAAVIVLNGVSLIIDVSDVWRYLSGERTPHLAAE